ncbi:hypothetical protein BCR44DRAFT_1009773 [Catenaria anguillulae PL171]|uniref:Secreted protein n=1 Tax=Catenaria anguillulae PL171 TaxID=765915 RepID=A0A1Y2I3X5_9FUNG|nr:hypothetical protein BCR44DRAFT_1009773 [Catenaria anguillulae PL171]
MWSLQTFSFFFFCPPNSLAHGIDCSPVGVCQVKGPDSAIRERQKKQGHEGNAKCTNSTRAPFLCPVDTVTCHGTLDSPGCTPGPTSSVTLQANPPTCSKYSTRASRTKTAFARLISWCTVLCARNGSVGVLTTRRSPGWSFARTLDTCGMSVDATTSGAGGGSIPS